MSSQDIIYFYTYSDELEAYVGRVSGYAGVYSVAETPTEALQGIAAIWEYETFDADYGTGII